MPCPYVHQTCNALFRNVALLDRCGGFRVEWDHMHNASPFYTPAFVYIHTNGIKRVMWIVCVRVNNTSACELWLRLWNRVWELSTVLYHDDASCIMCQYVSCSWDQFQGGVRKSKSFCVELQLCFLVTLETPHQGARNLNASGGYIASLGNTAMASVLLNGKKPQLGRGSVYIYIYISICM